MAKCAALDPRAGPAEAMLGQVDCFIQSNVQAAYAGLLGPGSGFGTALTIALTLYVAIVGYRLIFGRSALSIGEMAPRMLLIGALLALTSSWATYQTLVYDVLTDGPEDIAAMVMPGAGQQKGLTARVDVLAARMVDLADAWTEFDARVGSEAAPPASPTAAPAAPTGVAAFVGPRDSLGPNMLLLSALLLILGSAGVLVVAKIILGLLLMLGPVFAGLALFASTRGLTLGWARAAVMMALVPLMAMLTSAGAVAMLEPMLTSMIVAAGQGIFSMSQAMAMLVVIVLMLVVAIQLFRIGRTIVSGWTLVAGPSSVASAALTDGAASTSHSQSVIPQYNDRIQSLVGAIERTSMTQLAAAASPMQRSIMLPARADIAAGSAQDLGTNPDRRIARNRALAPRAPIKPFRSAA
jgi:type IV secretion system protein VirB6